MRQSTFTTAVVWTLAVLFTPAIILLAAVAVTLVVEYVADRRERREAAASA